MSNLAGGAAPIMANRDEIGPWERFTIIELGNNRVALLSGINRQYVCADSAGVSPLIANRDTIGLWETFIIVAVDKGIALKS